MGQTYAACLSCHKLNRVRTEVKKDPVCGSCGAKLPVHGAVVEANDASLAVLLSKSPLPVVVDVWAPWCAPCRAFAPTFQEFSEHYLDRAVFVKLNSDENQRSSGALGVRGIPTTLVFHNGQELTRQSGAIPREQFSTWLDKVLPGR